MSDFVNRLKKLEISEDSFVTLNYTEGTAAKGLPAADSFCDAQSSMNGRQDTRH